jgi:hypothetical protein
MVEGGQYVNMVAPEGIAFPANPDNGELFFRTDLKQLFVCKDSTGPDWKLIGESYRTFVMGEDLLEGALVKFDGSGEIVAIAAGAETKGILQEDALTGVAAQVALHGDISTVHSGLTPNSDYFIDAGGSVGTTRERMVLGYAISATEMLLTLDDRTIYNDQVDFPRIPQSFQVADITARDLISAVESDMVLVDDADGLGNPATYHYNDAAWIEVQTTHDGGTYGP